jgi:hypothetical protein
MAFDDDTKNLGEDMKDSYAEGKKDIKNAWADTKNAAEKTENELDAEVDKL